MKRRTVIVAGPVVTLGALAGLGRVVTAQEDALKPLDTSNTAAKALHFVEDAANADPEVYDRQSGQNCSNCIHFKGGDQALGGCALFPGYSVPAEGWCSGWVKSN